jgi:hypothetical protein
MMNDEWKEHFFNLSFIIPNSSLHLFLTIQNEVGNFTQ